MSLGDTWTSPRLERGSRRAASPLRNGVRSNPDSVFGAARVDRPPSAGLTPSQILRRRIRPVPTKTIGALDDPAAAQFSSFAPDGCFPAAVAVRDPLRSANSPMAAQVAARKRRHGLRSAMAARDIERDISAQELARVRCCSALDFRPTTPMSEYTSSRPATSAAVGTYDLGDTVPPEAGATASDGAAAASCDVPVTSMFDAAHHHHGPSVVDRGNSSHMGTEVPVLRVGAPMPRHPLGMGSGSAVGSSVRAASADGRPMSAATTVNSAARMQTKLASAAAMLGKAARPASAASSSAPVTPQTGPSRPQSAVAVAPTTAAVAAPTAGVVAAAAAALSDPSSSVAVGPGTVRGMRKTLHWQLRKAAGTPASSAAHGAAEDSAMNTETMSLLLRPVTPGFASRPSTPAAGDAGATAAAVAINVLLRDRPGTAPQRHATPARGASDSVGDEERVGSGSDFAYRPLRAFAY
jgi:hypothetical protein